VPGIGGQREGGVYPRYRLSGGRGACKKRKEEKFVVIQERIEGQEESTHWGKECYVKRERPSFGSNMVDRLFPIKNRGEAAVNSWERT